MIRSLFFLTIFTVSCGNDRFPCSSKIVGSKTCAKKAVLLSDLALGKPSIDNRLAPLLDEFLDESRNHGVEIDLEENRIHQLKFSETINDGHANGKCKTRAHRTMEGNLVYEVHSVEISEALIPDEFKLKRTFFHELGHCLLGKNHDPNPRSMMHYQNILSNETIEHEWSRLLKTLFN